LLDLQKLGNALCSYAIICLQALLYYNRLRQRNPVVPPAAPETTHIVPAAAKGKGGKGKGKKAAKNASITDLTGEKENEGDDGGNIFICSM